MNKLSQQIQQLLPREKQFLYQIYIKTIEDYAYLWEEFPDIEKLRKILLFIVKLFLEEHKGLNDLNQLDQEKFKKAFRELISSHDALLQKTRKAEIKEIEGIGIKEWLKEVKRDMMTINEIIEKNDKLLPIERLMRVIKYDDLSWRVPRTTLDFLCAYIQVSSLGFYDWRDIEWQGLLNIDEKLEFKRNWEQAYNASKQKPNLLERFNSVLNRYKNKSITQPTDITGLVFYSEALYLNRELMKKEIYQARISFSIFLPKVDQFFELMIRTLSEGILKGIPVKFKILRPYYKHQGSGNNAHLYFGASYEKEVYNALTDYIYPELEKKGLNALGGRFLMIPIMDKSGKILKGVDFGQDFYKRHNVPERNKIIEESTEPSNDALSTNELIGEFSSRAIRLIEIKDQVYFRDVYTKHGKRGLINDTNFIRYTQNVQRMLRTWARNPDYPILDSEATFYFKNFTKTILERRL